MQPYPFSSDSDYIDDKLLDDTLKNATGPVIEIGGPTFDGYPVLSGRKLPEAVTIMNISRKRIAHDKRLNQQMCAWIDETQDIRHPQLPKNSYGIILSSYLMFTSKKGWWRWKSFDFDNLTKEDKLLADNPTLTPRYGLRYLLAYHAFKALKPQGILIVRGFRQAERDYALARGFKEIYSSSDESEDSIECLVLQKPSSK